MLSWQWFLLGVASGVIVMLLFYCWDALVEEKRSLVSLNLNPLEVQVVKIKLPASAFPQQRADIYICDGCGRDITRYLHLGHAHVRTPMGPERFLCGCGQKYLTGAIEWDHMSGWQREQRTMSISCLVMVSLVLAFPGVVVYLALRSRPTLLSTLGIAAVPFILLTLAKIPGWLAILASIRRTRSGNNIIRYEEK